MRTKLKLSYIVYTLLILSNLIFIHDTSALSYQSDINVSFTFNPTISVSISNDLTIPNLTPGTASDSNEINVNVTTNNAYGYNLYATVGNSTYNNTNLANTSNDNNNIDYTFTTISPTANLPSLDTDNTWGYSYSLDNGSTWSNYNGLSIYTTDNPTRLTKNTGPSEDTINFKIAAKAGSTQPSGTYSNVINFIAITKPSLITLADAYASESKELYHGYYKMQDMTHTICEETEDIGAQLQVIDIRDDKVYWISKLADNNCWMTQNLDLDIDETKIYTHNDTDLGWTTLDENVTWQPTEGHSTIDFTGNTVDGWVDSYSEPYSANPGDVYYYTSNSTASDTKYNSLQECVTAGHNDCVHYHAGNYYNGIATLASNSRYSGVSNSICPSNWRLPTYTNTNDFGKLLYFQGIAVGPTTNTYTSNGFNLARVAPVYLVRAGGVYDNGNLTFQWGGLYWSNTSGASSNLANLAFNYNYFAIQDYSGLRRGHSVRCLAR